MDGKINFRVAQKIKVSKLEINKWCKEEGEG